MLNDNFYRGSGITFALQRLLETANFQAVEVYLAGCETLNGARCLQEATGMVSPERYRCFDLMQSGPGLLIEIYRFARWVRAMRFDILHVHHRRLAVLASVTKPLHGTPVLFTGHLTFPEAAWFRQFAPRTMTGVSPSVVDYLRRSTKATTVTLIYNPVEFPEYPPGPALEGRRTISVGRLEEVKSYDRLIAAWSQLSREGCEAKLDIFGEGSLRPALEAQIRAAGLEGQVNLCGFSASIRELLPNYAFNILVSRKEGFPNAVVEAAAFGLPSLLTDVDGSRDALPSGLALPNGIPWGDVPALSAALALWLKSPQLLREDGRRFYEELKPRVSPDVVGRQYLDLYSRMSAAAGGVQK